MACTLACVHTSSVASCKGLALSVGSSRVTTLGSIIAISQASPPRPQGLTAEGGRPSFGFRPEHAGMQEVQKWSQP